MEHDAPTTPELLSGQPAHPQRLAFVLKLHRDCLADPTCLKGRIEHPASGRRGVFHDLGELHRWLQSQLAASPQ